MKVRRRRVTRRYRGAASPSPPPILPPPDLATEIEQSVEARDRLDALAAHAAAERDKSKPDFLRLFAGEMRSIGTDSNNVLERLAAWQAQDARAAQRSEALRQLSEMFKERVDQFKLNSKDEAEVALRRIIGRLTVEREKPDADKNAINKRIERLLAEQESLRPASPPAPPPPAPPRPPKEIATPPQRPAKGKPQPRERGGI
ncbi:MAG TPA: hypothetical protein VFV58_32390 [Blastocatellia bacterium]|nr:hypothetical protein [Blastocatellia bacterium]